MSKIVQQAVANKLGLLTPSTLVTTSKTEALGFLASGAPHILKCFGGNLRGDRSLDEQELLGTENIFSQLVTRDDVDNAAPEQLEACPHMFQTAIHKSYELRIVVIRNAVYAFRINSGDKEYTRADWRRGGPVLKFERTTIPEDLIARLLEFMKHFDLFSGSFDFIVDSQDRCWFLECNTEGAWGWLDDVVNGEIADEFANAFQRKLSELREEKARTDLTVTLRRLSYAHPCAESA